MQESTLEGDRWETEVEKDLHSSSHEVPRVSVSTTDSTSDPLTVAGGTGTYDADTGTDFGLLENYTKGPNKHPHTWRRLCSSVLCTRSYIDFFFFCVLCIRSLWRI